VFEEVSAAIGSLRTAGGGYECVNFGTLERLEQDFLAENRVVSPDLLKVEGDRGVACDRSCRMSVMINEEDHIRVQCMDAGLRTEELWESVDEVDDELGERLALCYDGRLGYLTCCPTNAGTGLRVSFLLHLPGLVLTKTIDQVLQGASQMGISTRGFFGEHSEIVGNFFQLSNQATMGADEREFLGNTRAVIERVIGLEREARERIVKGASAELTDKAWRAYGILQYARTLQVRELLNLASALRLGVECGVFGDATVETINKAVLLAMPAHLQRHHGAELSAEACSVVRAEVVRTLIGGKGRGSRASRRAKK
jgi:protein arginine kinase